MNRTNKKIKITMSILLAVTAVMLVISFALITQFLRDYQAGIADKEDVDALLSAGAWVLMLLIVIPAGFLWLVDTAVFVIFIPLILTARAIPTMRTRIHVLYVFMIVLLILTAFTLTCMIIAVFVPYLFVTLLASIGCFVGTFVAVCIFNSQLRDMPDVIEDETEESCI